MEILTSMKELCTMTCTGWKSIDPDLLRVTTPFAQYDYRKSLEKHVFRYPMSWPRFVRHVGVEGSILDKTHRCCITWYDDELLNLALFIIIYIQRQLMYFYSKTNQMHNISNLFYFGTTLYMFRTVFPPIIRSLWLYIQHQLYVIQVLWLLASKLSVYLNLVLGTRTKC
jgi:hypothetical protein